MSAILQDQNTATKDWYKQLFQTYQQGLNGHKNHPLAQFRLAAYQQLEAEAFPTRRDEDWKYSGAPVARMMDTHFQEASATQLTAADIAAFRIPNLEAATFVFINGVLQRELSEFDKVPAGVELLTVSAAIEDEEKRQWMEQQVAHAGGTEQNTFLALNRAFAQHGLYIEVSANAQVALPIHCLYLNTAGEQAHQSHPQMFIRSRKGSEFSVIESYQVADDSASYFTNTANWASVEGNARLHHYKLQFEGAQALQVNDTLVRQDRDSIYSSYALDLGGKVVRNNISTTLLNSNTETNYYGVYFGSKQQHIDNQTFIDHAVPHCQSNELYKGILTDYARGVFNGKVMVRQDAQKTNAFQQNSSLVLSPNAIMDAKPQLEIYADDVRCSHGATIGQLDEKSIFYLRSRGIPEAQARHLLQQAFVGEAIEAMPNDAVREWALGKLAAKFNA
ncbi:MAG: Fe-S cluster assembly protein SufD [Bacteroidota bacterium]